MPAAESTIEVGTRVVHTKSDKSGTVKLTSFTTVGHQDAPRQLLLGFIVKWDDGTETYVSRIRTNPAHCRDTSGDVHTC